LDLLVQGRRSRRPQKQLILYSLGRRKQRPYKLWIYRTLSKKDIAALDPFAGAAGQDRPQSGRQVRVNSTNRWRWYFI